jgi:hypothetical protein
VLNYREYAEQFENDYSSVVDARVLELSRDFDKYYADKNEPRALAAINESLDMLENEYNIPTRMQISYNIATAYGNLRIFTGVEYIEKEMYYFRYAIDLYETNFLVIDRQDCPETRVAENIAMKAYTNIGNSMRNIGRYIAAIDNYNNALLIQNSFAMASLNLSTTLFSYAQLQIKTHEQQYYHHACYYYYKLTKMNKINLEEQKYLASLEEMINKFSKDYIEGYLSKELILPIFEVENQDEADYRNHILLCRLFLEPCLDIRGDNCFAVDSLNLPLQNDSSSNGEFIGLFNQIKQEYNAARYLWYHLTVLNDPLLEELKEHFSDKELDIIPLNDTADYSLRENLLRTAFKTAYSVFDRVAYFMNEYFSIGLIGRNVSFKNIWKESAPNPIMKAYGHNSLVIAMYWLQKDFYEDSQTNVTSPNAEPIFQMRNDMEHNCLRTVKVVPHNSNHYSFTKFTTEYQIENNTYKLLKLLREMIIYVCLAINLENINSNKLQ